jgi:thiamine-monophosphate kinase
MAMEFQMGVAACALSGGEDYELLFTINQDDYGKISRNKDITVIGYVTEQQEGAHLMTKGGAKHKLTAQGWKSF